MSNKHKEFDKEWNSVQEGGRTSYQKVNKLIAELEFEESNFHGNEFNDDALEKIHKLLQKEIFGEVLDKKPLK
jgi:hypothetical protein